MPQSPAAQPKFVLASTSPRRIELLSQVGLNPIVLAPNADEAPLRGETPRQTVARLARDKARSLYEKVLQEHIQADTPADTEKHVRALIIAADTIVVAPNSKIFNKPRDRSEAIRMLSALSGKAHTVLTGYCILEVKTPARAGSPAHSKVRVISSRVHMRKLPRRDIERYVDSGEPMDKAGSYAAQGLGMALIERISGSYMNVVGLPVAQVLQDLEEHFGIPLFSWKEWPVMKGTKS